MKQLFLDNIKKRCYNLGEGTNDKTPRDAGARRSEEGAAGARARGLVAEGAVVAVAVVPQASPAARRPVCRSRCRLLYGRVTILAIYYLGKKC